MFDPGVLGGMRLDVSRRRVARLAPELDRAIGPALAQGSQRLTLGEWIRRSPPEGPDSTTITALKDVCDRLQGAPNTPALRDRALEAGEPDGEPMWREAAGEAREALAEFDNLPRLSARAYAELTVTVDAARGSFSVQSEALDACSVGSCAQVTCSLRVPDAPRFTCEDSEANYCRLKHGAAEVLAAAAAGREYPCAATTRAAIRRLLCPDPISALRRKVAAITGPKALEGEVAWLVSADLDRLDLRLPAPPPAETATPADPLRATDEDPPLTPPGQAVALLERHPDGLGKAALMEALGLTEAGWLSLRRQLASDVRVVLQGAPRAAVWRRSP